MSTTKVTNQTNKGDDLLTIKDVAREYGFSEVYIRRCVTKFQNLKVHKREEIAKNTEKIWFKRSDVEAWRAGRKSRSRRDDGRGKYTMYLNHAEEQLVSKLIKSNPELAEIEFFRTNRKAE